MADVFGELKEQQLIIDGQRKYKTLFKSVTGSRLYGTEYEKGDNPLDKEYISDYDYRGVFVAPLLHHISNEIKVPETVKLTVDDVEFYELKKFFNMASANNPNIMDLLYSDKRSILYASDEGTEILENRDLFMSQLVKDSFIGYASAQLNRIKTHYRWARDYPEIYEMQALLTKAFLDGNIDFQWIADYFSGELAKKITGETADIHAHIEFDMSLVNFISHYKPKFDVHKFIKPSISNYMTLYDLDYIKISNQKNYEDFMNKNAGYDKFGDSIIHLKNGGSGIFNRAGTLRKKTIHNTNEAPKLISTINHSGHKKGVKDINSIWEWKVKRNPKRAILEEKYGYDTKHGMHLYRLLASVNNLLETGEYEPRLSGKILQTTKDIRNGLVPYEDLIKMSNELQEKAIKTIVLGNSALPKKPNYAKIDRLMLSIYANL
jgi:predicted nucleotidyltransferase